MQKVWNSWSVLEIPDIDEIILLVSDSGDMLK